MPLDKKGNYHLSPRRAQMADADEPKDDGHEPDQDEGGGDGLHHHEMTKHEDGHYSSVHTHPDGSKEEAEHDSYDDAQDHQDRMMGEGGEQEDPEVETEQSPEDEPEDIAGMYAR